MKKMSSFTKIGQFKQVIRDACWYNPEEGYKPPPVIDFEGTVKLHGTNAGVSYTEEDGMWVQSRKRIITVNADNAGFAFFVDSHKLIFKTWLKSFHKAGHTTTIFGEWCGGNIQKGVAINGLEKMFVIFGIKYKPLDEEKEAWYEKIHVSSISDSIYNANMFEKYHITIDFSNPQEAQHKIVEMVEAVEKECPVGKYFGVSGVGEGIVFCAYDDNGHREFIFKAKGKKHSSSNVKTIAAVDIDKVRSIDEFVNYAVTENRLNQAIEQVFTSTNTAPDIKHTGTFLKWVSSDVFAEETDTLKGNGLEPKDVGRALSQRAKKWYMEYLDSLT